MGVALTLLAKDRLAHELKLEGSSMTSSPKTDSLPGQFITATISSNFNDLHEP